MAPGTGPAGLCRLSFLSPEVTKRAKPPINDDKAEGRHRGGKDGDEDVPARRHAPNGERTNQLSHAGSSLRMCRYDDGRQCWAPASEEGKRYPCPHPRLHLTAAPHVEDVEQGARRTQVRAYAPMTKPRTAVGRGVVGWGASANAFIVVPCCLTTCRFSCGGSGSRPLQSAASGWYAVHFPSCRLYSGSSKWPLDLAIRP
jgi:hypothetical protein